MINDIPRLIEILKTALLRELGDEVELIFRYGSHLKGVTHPYSDIDISYVPVHESTWNSITVLVEDTLIDLYAIHWSKLERMAEYEDVSSTVLLNTRVVYAKSDAILQRFNALAERFQALLQPPARPEMLRKAHRVFMESGYSYYLLRQEAASGHLLGSRQQAQRILKTVLHALVLCNQSCADTRKLEQVLSLPRLPAGFAETVEHILSARTSNELLAASEILMETARNLLLAEQQAVLLSQDSFQEVFDSAYPELKGDLQHVLLACDRRDWFALQDRLLSVYQEWMLLLSQVFTHVQYSGFNSLTEYEQALEPLGFPNLWSYAEASDFAGLHRQCREFDRCLQRFLTGHSVSLNSFPTVNELEAYLAARNEKPCPPS